MDIHSLANRLQILDDESIRDLHDQLLTTCTGRTTEARPEILREIAIIETTDSLRGALLGDLLGQGDDLDVPWLPDGRKNRIFSTATIRYHSDDSSKAPVFYQDNQNFPRTTLDANAATAVLTKGKSSSISPVSIQTHFRGLPTGWSCWLVPTISPHSDHLDVDQLLPQDTCWVLVCRNLHAAKTILPRITERPPVLIVLDEPEETIPAHLHDIRVVPRSEGSTQIREFCERTELFSNPDKKRMIRVILNLQQHAAHVISQGKAHAAQKRSAKLVLERAAIAWERMFIDERRGARHDLQLKVVSHPMQKTLLIMRSEREAQVNHYVGRHLIPLIKNFLKSQCLEFKTLELHAVIAEQFQGPKAETDKAMHLRAGLLFALPSIGLIFPNLQIPPTAIAESTSEWQSGSQLASEISSGIFSPVTDWLRVMFDEAKEGFKDMLSAPFDRISNQLETLNQGVGTIIGILFAGQVAVVIGIAIAAVIHVKGSISLSETETMLDDLLNRTEAMWPQIEENLSRLLPAFNGAVDQDILERARLVIHQINKF